MEEKLYDITVKVPLDVSIRFYVPAYNEMGAEILLFNHLAWDDCDIDWSVEDIENAIKNACSDVPLQFTIEEDSIPMDEWKKIMNYELPKSKS